jgi:hypothetical protein
MSPRPGQKITAISADGFRVFLMLSIINIYYLIIFLRLRHMPKRGKGLIAPPASDFIFKCSLHTLFDRTPAG